MEGIARYFETVSALASEGRVHGRGLIRNPLQFALTISELLDARDISLVPAAVGAAAARDRARRAGLRAYHEPPAEVRGP